MQRRTALTLIAAACAPGLTFAQLTPGPVKIIVGFAPGGAVDVIARSVAQQLQGGIGQPVIVENRPGAGTNIAMKALIDSSPDGHTLMLTANSISANPSLYQPAPFDPARDVTPITLVGRVPVVIATNAGAGPANMAAFIAAAKAQKRSLSYGSPGNGSTPHLAMELFERAAGIELLHVPYRGGAPAITDVIAGHLPLIAVNALEVQPHVKSGRLRVLAVLSPQRTSIFPDVPSIAEAGFPGFESSVWYGFIGPAKLPAPVVAQLDAALQKAVATPDVRDRLVGAGGEATPAGPQALGNLIAAEQKRYAQVIREAGIKPD